jgi:hypothetical protein
MISEMLLQFIVLKGQAGSIEKKSAAFPDFILFQIR